MTRAPQAVLAVFGTDESAREAIDYLVISGIAMSRITLSRSTTEDGIAAENPGQSFENQPGQGRGAAYGSPLADSGPDEAERRSARSNTRMRAKARVVSIEADSEEQRAAVTKVLQAHGGELIDA
jgi:hypothetical protein